MVFQLASRLTMTLAAFVFPTYASYKAVKSNDLQKLEVWLMYWAVMGVVLALESTVEWFFAWLPFYYEIKTIAVLWLTLPQIQGSTYVYLTHLHPFLLAHETDIDAALADAKVKAKQVGLEWLNKAVQRVRQAVIGTLAPQLLAEPQRQEAVAAPHPTAGTDGTATSQLYSLAGNVLRTYGPAAVAAGTAFLHPMNGRTPSIRAAGTSSSASAERPERERPPPENYLTHPRTGGFPSTSTTGRSHSMTSAQARMRRAELESQLAELDANLSSASSSSPSSAASSPPSHLAYPSRHAVPPYHPRSVSANAAAGPYPASLSVGNGPIRPSSSSSSLSRDPIASRSDASLVNYGFEKIGKEELTDYPPVSAAAMDPGQTSPGGTKRPSSWWWFSAAGGAGYAPLPATDPAVEKKNA